MADVSHQRFALLMFYTPTLTEKSIENFQCQLFGGRDSWLLCLICLPGVSLCLCGSSSRAMVLSAVCDCGIS